MKDIVEHVTTVCPRCKTKVSVQCTCSDFIMRPAWIDKGSGYRAAYGFCNECEQILLFLMTGEATQEFNGMRDWVDSPKWKIAYPSKGPKKLVDPDVPPELCTDFNEARAVLELSPKSSAALARRILQHVLRDHFKIKHGRLSNEIGEFIARTDVPTLLKDAVDAIRNLGNLAAHPMKDLHTGEVVSVEPGEAEWLLEVVESLFDFAYIQPARLAAKKAKLNQKLASIGQKPMK